MIHQGEVLIHSSFGSFCHYWSNVSVPFKEFLVSVSYESFMRKTLGLSYRVYCQDATSELFKQMLAAHTAANDITQAQADSLMAEYLSELSQSDMPHTNVGYVQTIDRLVESDEVQSLLTADQIETVFAESRLLQGMKPNPQAVGFWQVLWPELRAELLKELEQAKSEIATA